MSKVVNYAGKGKGKSRGLKKGGSSIHRRDDDMRYGGSLLGELGSIAKKAKLVSTLTNLIPGRVGSTATTIAKNLGLGKQASGKQAGGKKKRRKQMGKGFLADVGGLLAGFLPGVGRFAGPLASSGLEHLGLGKQAGGKKKSMKKVVPVGPYSRGSAVVRAPPPVGYNMIGGALGPDRMREVNVRFPSGTQTFGRVRF